MAERVNILSIDGGGIRGIIPALVLAELEERCGKPTARLFDLIAGTSTGGILALALTKPLDGAPAFSASRLVRLYEEEGPEIFDRSIWRFATTLGGLIEEKYSNDALAEALRTFLGDARLSDSLTDVLLTAYEIERRRPFFFKSARALSEPGRDFLMRDAALATSSAPSFFEPVAVRPVSGEPSYALVDGGVFAANPAMTAFAEVRRHDPGADVFILSLGTGELTRPIPLEDAQGFGLVEWVRPLISVIFDGVSDAVDYELDQLLGPSGYLRLQTVLDEASDDLDDASADNLRALRREGEELVEAHGRELDALCERLAR